MKRTVLKDIEFDHLADQLQAQVDSVHTRNGDTIEVHFSHPKPLKGTLSFGYGAWMEFVVVTLDFDKKKISIDTTDWTLARTHRAIALQMKKKKHHVLMIAKTAGSGRLVKKSNVDVFLDSTNILSMEDLNLLPEIGVHLRSKDISVLRFIHKGVPSEMPEYLHVAGWQMMNKDSIEYNVESIFRGLKVAAEKGVQLLVTPETSLTGLFPTGRVTKDRKAISAAEGKIRKYLRELKDAPYLVVGLPVWENSPGHRRKETRYNVSRVYSPDGDIVSTHSKIHSCETDFWHGYRLNEFDVYNVPVCMHICHDVRYPEVWTLPVMFGARLIIHPANCGRFKGSIDTFEAVAKGAVTTTSHAFYLYVNGGGGSFISGPQKYDNLIAVSDECRREVKSFPMVDEPCECLVEAIIRVEDAYGYWPVRSFRASEEIASSYYNLYKAMGGKREL